MDKRYQVFISSTFADLEDERKVVMEAILQCNCFPAGMEMFPALDMDQFEYIKSIIDRCDYYVLIVAGRYGSLAPDKIGYTEKEYRYAIEKGIPVLAFVKRDIDNIPAKHTDQDKSLKKKLVNFRQEIGVGRLINMWDDKHELRSKICLSLKEAFESSPRTGWVRADRTENEYFTRVYEMVNRDMPLQKKYNPSKLALNFNFKYIEFIIIIGNLRKQAAYEDYNYNVRKLFCEKAKMLGKDRDLFDTFVYIIDFLIGDINMMLQFFDIVNISNPDNICKKTIELTELGMEIYIKSILDS